MIYSTDFIHNFNSDDLPKIVTTFFDEIMVLYNLIGSRQDIDVCTDNKASVATFVLLMDSEKEAKDLYSTLNATYFSVYGIKFNIDMTLSNESIKTIVRRVS